MSILFYKCTNNIDVICDKKIDFKIYFFILTFFTEYDIVNMQDMSLTQLHQIYVTSMQEKIGKHTFIQKFRYMIEKGLFKEVKYFGDRCLEIVKDNTFDLHHSVLDILAHSNSDTIQLFLWLHYKYVPGTFGLVFKVGDIVQETGRSITNTACRKNYLQALDFLFQNKIIYYEKVPYGYRIFMVQERL